MERRALGTLGRMWTRFRFGRDAVMARWTALSRLTGDGLLYLVAAVFAIVLGLTSRQPAQWQWGYLSFTTYALVAVVALLSDAARSSARCVASGYCAWRCSESCCSAPSFCRSDSRPTGAS